MLCGHWRFCFVYIDSFFQTDHSTLWWMVVGVNWLTLYQECRRGSVLGSLLFLLYTSGLSSILENKLIGYADHSTLMAVVPSPGVRVAVAEFLIRDLDRVSEWCDLWGMKLNASKTKTMLVSRSRTMHPQSPALTSGGTVLKEYDDVDILGVTFDSKMTFEKHLCSVSRAASRRLGILRMPWRVFHDRSLLGICFQGFVLRFGVRFRGRMHKSSCGHLSKRRSNSPRRVLG